jgi:hypothetical protein
MRSPLPLLALVVGLAGCAGQSATHAGSARSSAPAASTPMPGRSLIAISDAAGAGRTALSLVTLDGAQVARMVLPESAHPSPGVGGGMLTFVDGGQLRGLTSSGKVEVLGPVAGSSSGPVVSPDGQHWMWADSSVSGMNITSRLILGSRGSPDRVIAQQTSQERRLAPYRWTSAGPTYVDAPSGIGGYILFAVGGSPSWHFDPDTGHVTSLLAGATCELADLAADGTVACIKSFAVGLVSPTGHMAEVPLPRPAFNFYGAVSFAPGSSATTLVVGGATGAGTDGKPEHYETDLLDVTSRTLRQFGPAGLRPVDGPWSWLPDGSLLTYRPAGPFGAFGGDPGVYVVAPDGSAKKVLSTGEPLGVIAG